LKVLYYISGHGFGHVSRSMEIIREFLKSPAIESVTVSTERVDFIREENPKLKKRNIGMDVGVYQKDSLSLDVDKTLYNLEVFEKNKSVLLESESHFAIQEDFDIIISDSASLPFVIGVQAKIPTVYIGNFTWDFIYSNFAKYHPYFGVVSNILKLEYSFASLALTLPFACPMEGFMETKEIGLVGRKCQLTRKSARELFEFNDQNIYFLFSFGAYGLQDVVWDWSSKPANWIIISSELSGFESEQIHNIPGVYYPDLVKASDYVVTKPGYGIISESILAGTPMIYTDRGDFAEYPHLVMNLERNHPSAYISQKDLKAFRFQNAMEKILKFDRTRRDSIPLNGQSEVLPTIQKFLN
jgi:hypothetical protein